MEENDSTVRPSHTCSKQMLCRSATVGSGPPTAFASPLTASSTRHKDIASGNDPQKALNAILADYLSPAHRDTCTGGCPASAFPVDAARSGKDVQTAFADGIEPYLEILAARMDGDKRETRQRAVALLSGIVGALLLSRAVKKGQPKLSDEFRSSARKQICKQRSQ